MSSVLVLADHPEIEALLADLVLFAGYHPVFVRADERPVDTMRRRSIDVLLLDAALDPVERCECEEIVRERSTAVVYCASTMRADELRTFAERRDALYFPLPNGPKFLRAVLHGALRAVGREPFDGRQTPPQIIAAVHAMAQARRITTVLRAKGR